jgi:hypothetical protein
MQYFEDRQFVTSSNPLSHSPLHCDLKRNPGQVEAFCEPFRLYKWKEDVV